MQKCYLKLIFIVIVALFFSGCTDDGDNIESCKQNGFKGVVIRSNSNFISCSDGEIKNDKYVTTNGMVSFQTSITSRYGGTSVYPNYYLEFK